MEWMKVAAVLYGLFTVFIMLAACVSWMNGDLEGNPLAYVFWPVIALTACIVTVKRMWREG